MSQQLNIGGKHRVLAGAAAAVGVVVNLNAAVGGTSANTVGPVQQGTSDGSSNYANNNPAVTISFSGQTALRNFDTTQGITELAPGTSIILHNGTNGGSVLYVAPGDAGTYVQLASSNFNSPDFGVGDLSATIQYHSAIRLEWHEQGSVQGQIDLINDQVGYVPVALGGTGPISNAASRGPSVSNPTWVNTNRFTAGGAINGFTLSGGNYADTYDSSVYNLATGVNLVGGQNRVQFSVGEYKTEGLAVGGTPSLHATAGSAGYGLGNPALTQAGGNISGLGVGKARQSFQPVAIANLSTEKVDPQSTTGGHYADGPWNTAGSENIDSTPIAVTAVGISANPGTGLKRLNLGDAQWLQTAGRLANGADYNYVSREVNTGQRIVVALNTGIDPSWAVGENDDGNTSGTAAANAQHSIGEDLRFSGKTSGSESQRTISQSRLGIGALSIAETRGAGSNAPVRALDIDFNDLVDPTLPGGATDASKFVRESFDTIVSSDDATRWKAVLISHYNTIKAPNQTALENQLVADGINPATATAEQQQAAWGKVRSFDPATAQTDSTPASAPISGIKGDTTGDVAAFISNIVNSAGTAAAGLTANNVNNPADNLFINGFLIPGLLNYTRVYDGGAITPVTLDGTHLAVQANVKANYGSLFTADNSAGANAQTIGVNSVYGAYNTDPSAIHGAIPITAKDAAGNTVGNGVEGPKGNWLFGNFNQDGRRDFASVKESLNAVLSLHQADGAANSIFTADGGVANSTVIPSLSGSPGWAATANTKGDLVVLGDFNSDGRFDGEDVYLLARGQSLSDNASTDHLSGNFADAARNPNAHLNKNAALDYIDAALSNPGNADQAFVRRTASANLVNDPNGVNAFNKRDVNRDGKLDLNDAFVVDKFYGQDYRNLDQQLAATLNVDGTITPTGAQRSVSLVDVELTDNGVIDGADIGVVNQALAGSGNESWVGVRTKVGGGNIVVARTGGSVSVAAGALLDVAAGQFTLGGTRDVFTDTTTGTHLAIAASGTGVIQISATGSKVAVAGLTISGSGKVDITGNSLAIDYVAGASPIDSVRSYLLSGRSGGVWTGSGLTSSNAQADPQKILAVAYVESSDLPGDRQTALLGHLGDGSTLVANLTYYGDANDDGVVNGDDYALVDRGFARSVANPHWVDGDFNYDGVVNVGDFFLLDRTFGILSGSLSPGLLAERRAEFGEEYVEQLVASVPEPSPTIFAALALPYLARRRRRRGD